MPQIPEILENKRNIAHLAQAQERGRLSHAYIINGPEGSGKRTFVRYISTLLLCGRKQGGKPCGECPACAKVLSGNHPDIIYLKREKEKTITVGEVRQQIIDDITVKPYYGPYKIYIVEDAQLMNESAQNALLKTIEEPPEYAVIFLLSENADSFLDTIRSRCIRLDMDRLSKETIKEYLVKRLGIEESEAEKCASFARGNLGRAADMAGDEAERNLNLAVTGLLKKIKDMNAVDIFEAASEQGKSSAKDVLEISRMWYRDVLMIKAAEGSAFPECYFSEEAGDLKVLADRMSYEGLNSCLKSVDTAAARLKANVKAEAVLENMFLDFRRNSKEVRKR